MCFDAFSKLLINIGPNVKGNTRCTHETLDSAASNMIFFPKSYCFIMNRAIVTIDFINIL